MLIDFRKDRTVIPAIKINDCVLERVLSCKLLGLWIDDDLKWKTNTEYIVKNAAKRLHFLKILKGYNAPGEDLKTFYISAIRSILEYGTKIWHGSLTEEQFKNIERIQRRTIKIICTKDLRTGIDLMWYGNFGKSKRKDVYKIDKRYERSYTQTQ